MSTQSWADCADKNVRRTCPEDMTVCYKLQRVENNNGTEVHFYQKGCGILEFCNGEECVMQGQRCKVDCCNTDACNESSTLNLKYMMHVLVGLLTAAYHV